MSDVAIYDVELLQLDQVYDVGLTTPIQMVSSNDYEDLINKPSINGVELMGNKSTDDLGIEIPEKVSDLTNDAGYITSAALPTKVSDLTNDSGYITNETDPTVPSWAKTPTKPTYTAKSKV